MPFVVEMTGYDPVAAVEKTVLFSMGEGIPFTDAGYAYSGLMRWASPSQKVDVSDTGVIGVGLDAGELTISNQPQRLTDAGPFDALGDWVWQYRSVKLYWVNGRVWADRVKVARGVLEQPIVNLSVNGSSIGSSLRFPMRDPRAALDVPLQNSKFAGDNVGDAGLEGGPDLKGRPKPIVYGLVSNATVPRVNEPKRVYMVADKVVDIVCVRDGATALTAGVVRANTNSLLANDPGPGKYDMCSGASGTYIRVGTDPIYNLTVDADEALGVVANRSHAKIWERFRTDRTDGTVNAASAAAFHAADGYEAGYYFSDETTVLNALGQILAGAAAFEVLNDDDEWEVRRIELPSGDPVIELAMLTPTLRKKAKTRILTELTRVRPNYAPNGAPPYRVSVKWGHNYTVMDTNAFTGGAIQRLRDKFGVEWRTASATDTSVWNPDTETGLFKNAPELTIESGYQPGPDYLTSPGAEGRAAELLAVFSELRGQYNASYVPHLGDIILPGDVVALTYPAMGLSAGALFSVLQFGLQLDTKGEVTAGLVIGLQTTYESTPADAILDMNGLPILDMTGGYILDL